jgi:hypothetical protein
MERAMNRAIVAALTVVCAVTSVQAQNLTAEDLARRTIERRAVEAVIWGMPVVNYDLMLQEMLSKTNGKVNEVIYWGRPLDWMNQTLTPNPDALYFMAFFNTKDGPIVLDLPPGDANGSFNGNIVTTWQMPLEDAGLLGYDKGAGAKYLILPPSYGGAKPEGYVALQSDTFGGYMLFRANLKSHSDADVQASITYGKRMKVYPLAQAANPPATVFTDVKDILFDSTIRYDRSFFEHLNWIVQDEPWLDRDRAMIDQLKSLGIEKGKPFNPNDATKTLLTSAVREGGTVLEQDTMRAYCLSFPKRAVGPIRRRSTSSKRCRARSLIPTSIRSIAEGSHTVMPLSASSIWAQASSIRSRSATRMATPSTELRPIA